MIERQPIRLSWRKKLAFAVATLITFFVAIEVLLRVSGRPAVRVPVDPYVGFSDLVPLMQPSIDENGVALMSTAPDKIRLFNDQSFAAVKRAGVRRIFCVGGSTTFGRPFDDATSYSGYLRALLPSVDPSVKWEVINAGGVSYASYRVAVVMQELSQFQPDIFVVYSAHNEFLERRTYASMYEVPKWRRAGETYLRKTRTYAAVESLVNRFQDTDDSAIDMLPGEVDERLNHTAGPIDYVRDDPWQADVAMHYETNLRRMVEIARAAGAKIVFVEPACNEKDCSPFKNEDEFFDLGQALFSTGDFDAAREAFGAAIDRDVCPLRATSTISELVRRVANEADLPLVPFDERLRQKCIDEYGHPCLGDEYFLDHVHPTIDIHKNLACWIIETLQQAGLIDGQLLDRETIARVDVAIREKIDTSDQAIAFRNLAKVFHWSGKFVDAAKHAQNCLRLLEDDPESQFVLADSLVQIGRPDEAIERYERLLNNHDYERAFLPFAFLLVDQGQLESAKAYATLATASKKEERRATAFELLAKIHESLGEHELAQQTIAQSRQ